MYEHDLQSVELHPEELADVEAIGFGDGDEE